MLVFSSSFGLYRFFDLKYILVESVKVNEVLHGSV